MIACKVYRSFNQLLIVAILVLSAVLSVSCGGNSSGTGDGGGAASSTSADGVPALTIRLPLSDSMKREGDYVEARSYDTIRMGRIAEGEQVEGKFQITNTSTDKPLVIVQVITGCGCTTADYDPTPMPGGTSRMVTYRFDSRGRIGHQFKSIEIITAQRQCATVYLDGEVYMPGQ